MELSIGYRSPLDSHFNLEKPLLVTVEVIGSGEYDVSCFGLNEKEILYHDDYMIFYNQLQSPNKEIMLSSGENRWIFAIQVGKLPSELQKMVFTINTEGEASLQNIEQCSITLSQPEAENWVFTLTGKDFQKEKAIIGVELYQKQNIWRYAAVGRGFNGGLSALLEHFGGEVEEEEEQAIASLPEEPIMQVPATPPIPVATPTHQPLPSTPPSPIKAEPAPAPDSTKLFHYSKPEPHLQRKGGTADMGVFQFQKAEPSISREALPLCGTAFQYQHKSSEAPPKQAKNIQEPFAYKKS